MHMKQTRWCMLGITHASLFWPEETEIPILLRKSKDARPQRTHLFMRNTRFSFFLVTVWGSLRKKRRALNADIIFCIKSKCSFWQLWSEAKHSRSGLCQTVSILHMKDTAPGSCCQSVGHFLLLESVFFLKALTDIKVQSSCLCPSFSVCFLRLHCAFKMNLPSILISIFF